MNYLGSFYQLGGHQYWLTVYAETPGQATRLFVAAADRMEATYNYDAEVLQ